MTKILLLQTKQGFSALYRTSTDTTLRKPW